MRRILLVSLLVSATMAGCLSEDLGDVLDPSNTFNSLPTSAVQFHVVNTGTEGREPTLGITSSGCIFYQGAVTEMARSCDSGQTWDIITDPFFSPTTLDPWLWVDPVTDRIFQVQLYVAESWIAYSDDDGETWLASPFAGSTPVQDHQKLATGPWTSNIGYGTLGGLNPLYETAVYYCYNKIAGLHCSTSFDGGVTFPVGGNVVGLVEPSVPGFTGGLTAAPDGTVYLSSRLATPTVFISRDNGLTWESRTMGEDVGTPSPQKNSETSTDTENNAYHTWVGADFGVYLSTSTDAGDTWRQDSLRVSPESVTSTAFPHMTAGSPGRVGFTYYGSTDYVGNPHSAPNDGSATYYLYYSYTLNALDENPIFETFRLTDDPVQIGSICISSGDCQTDDNGRSNRNHLDFNDLHIDQDGRVHIAFTDGCVDECAENFEDLDWNASHSGVGMAAILAVGPSLYEEKGRLQDPWLA